MKPSSPRIRQQLLILNLTALLGIMTPGRGADWEVQTVHTAVPNTYPVAPTLAGGPAGSIHLTYVLYGPASNGLFHAEQPFNGRWQTQQVLPDPGPSLASLLATTVDSSGAPHLISYNYGAVQHSVRTGAGWTTEPIPGARGWTVDPGRAAFNTAAGPQFVFWDSQLGRLRTEWKTGPTWNAGINTTMAQYTNGYRVSALMDAPDAGTELFAVFHDGGEQGNLRISRWDGSRWGDDSVVAENVDARAPFSATWVTTFNVRYIYVAFTRSPAVFEETLFVTRRPLSALPNAWSELALTNVYELQFEGLTLRAGNFHVAIGYHSFRLPQLLLAETAAGFEAMGNLEPQEVPMTGNVDDFDMAIHNGNLWFAASTDPLRTLEVARLQLPGGNIPPEGRLLPNTIVYSAVTGASFEFQGEVGRSYRIEYIENLGSQNWMPLTNFIYATPIRITDTQAGGRSQRCYRAVSP